MLAELYPAPATTAASEQNTVTPEPFTGPAAHAPREAESADPRPLSPGPAPDAAAMATEQNNQQRPARTTASRPAVTTGPSSTSRRPAAKKATVKPAAPAAAAADPRFVNGPLAGVDVEDGQVFAYCIGGLVLDVPAKSIPALADWTLTEAKLGARKLSGPGQDADPLIVLTKAACERYGLPLHFTEEERLSGRLPEGHKVIKQLTRADWQLTKRGFGPWARIYRPAKGSERMRVQLCIPGWTRSTPGAGATPDSFRRQNSPGSWARTRSG